MKKPVKNTFENSFKRLEEILELLEGDEVSLEETIDLYEEGLKLSKECSELLQKAELRIKEINKSLKAEDIK